MQLIRCLLSNFYLNMFRATLCPSSGDKDRVLLHMVFCSGCSGCGCVQLGSKLCAQQCTQLHCCAQSISTCFGHYYAHHQEIKTVCYCIWCSALVVLAVVVCSWVVSCVHSSAHSCTVVHSLFQHVSGIVMPIIRR